MLLLYATIVQKWEGDGTVSTNMTNERENTKELYAIKFHHSPADIQAFNVLGCLIEEMIQSSLSELCSYPKTISEPLDSIFLHYEEQGLLHLFFNQLQIHFCDGRSCCHTADLNVDNHIHTLVFNVVFSP